MKNTFITKKEILDRLIEWKENTDIDIKSDWIGAGQRGDYIRQSVALAQCIGILSSLGENGNVANN